MSVVTALEVNGSMVPGVVWRRRLARTCFENEKKRTVDPGVVEHVKGNVWKTRIYPLNPGTPRKAIVACIREIEAADAAKDATVVETDGKDVFVGIRRGAAERNVSRADRLRKAAKAKIYWDASMSRNGRSRRTQSPGVPGEGDWELIVFRNIIEKPICFTERRISLKPSMRLSTTAGPVLQRRIVKLRPLRTQLYLQTNGTRMQRQGRGVSAKLAAGERPPA